MIIVAKCLKYSNCIRHEHGYSAMMDDVGAARLFTAIEWMKRLCIRSGIDVIMVLWAWP